MEPNGRIAVMVVNENEIKKPERKIITIEYESMTYGTDSETYVLSLTPDQYRLIEWLSDRGLLCDSLEWHDGQPEIKEI